MPLQGATAHRLLIVSVPPFSAAPDRWWCWLWMLIRGWRRSWRRGGPSMTSARPRWACRSRGSQNTTRCGPLPSHHHDLPHAYESGKMKMAMGHVDALPHPLVLRVPPASLHCRPVHRRRPPSRLAVWRPLAPARPRPSLAVTRRRGHRLQTVKQLAAPRPIGCGPPPAPRPSRCTLTHTS